MPKMYRVVASGSVTVEYYVEETGEVLARWAGNPLADEAEAIAEIKEMRKANKVKTLDGKVKDIDSA